MVWNEDDAIIRKISAYYNRVNHFQNFMPTWSTNIISTRHVWEQMGCPPPPKEPTELGRVVEKSRKTI